MDGSAVAVGMLEAMREQLNVSAVSMGASGAGATGTGPSALDLSNVSEICMPGSPIKVVHIRDDDDDLADASSSDDEDDDDSDTSDNSEGSGDDEGDNDLSWL